jgi:serine/threonine-protein kinase
MGTSTLPYSSIGEYRLVDPLGKGGMGEVYRAVHPQLGRVVAIKVLTPRGHGTDLVQRFRNEALIQAQLQHPHIAKLYGFQELGGRACIIMEYVDGQTLEERLRSRGPLPVAEAVRIFQAVVSAVGYIHRHGIIHRDLKANNIKLSVSGKVKLLDFGIAKAESTPKLTAAGETVGTLEYLAPELVKGGSASPQSDIWALGVLLYELVTGEMPFAAPTLVGLCDKIRRAAYAPPSTLNPAVPREVAAVIARCLKKNPADRYRSAGELLADLQQPGAFKEKAPARNIGERPLAPKLTWARPRRRFIALTAAVVSVLALALYLFGGDVPCRDCPPSGAKPVLVDVVEGRAEVYQSGSRVGSTPYELRSPPGARVDLMLKRQGFFDKPISFSVTEGKKVYTFTMEKKQ